MVAKTQVLTEIDPRRCKEIFMKILEEPLEATPLEHAYLKACTEYFTEGKTDALATMRLQVELARHKHFFSFLLVLAGLYTMGLAIDLGRLVSATVMGTLYLGLTLLLLGLSVMLMYGAIYIQGIDKPLRWVKEAFEGYDVQGWIGGNYVMLTLKGCKRR